MPEKDWKSDSTPTTAANKVAQEVFCLNLLQMLQILQILPYLRRMICKYWIFVGLIGFSGTNSLYPLSQTKLFLATFFLVIKKIIDHD